MQHFSSHRDKEWCGQCETLKAAPAVRACQSEFCKLKALLSPEVGFKSDPRPTAPPIDVHPAIIGRVERVRPAKVPKVKRKQRAMTNRVRDTDGLTPKSRRLLEQMKLRADERTGEVAISFNDLFEQVGCSAPSTVSPLMQTLIKTNMVSIVERKGGRAKTRYLIHGLAQKPPLGEPPAHIVGERQVAKDEVVPKPVIRIRAEASEIEEPTPTAMCVNCRFVHIFSIGNVRCRRYPPAPGFGFAKVDPQSWCGEWKSGE